MTTNLNDRIVARVEAGAAQAAGLGTKTRATLQVELRNVHFFEPGVTGMNLCQTSETAHALA